MSVNRVEDLNLSHIKRSTASNSKYRYVVLFWAALGLGFQFYLRVNLNVAIVAMVNRTAIGEQSSVQLWNSSTDDLETDGVTASSLSLVLNSTNELPSYERGTFVWSESIQGLILGAYFFGFTPTQVLAGRLVDRYNAVKFAGAGMLVSSILTMLIPIAAEIGVIPLCLIRGIIGVTHGPYGICIFVLISRWLPRTERSMATATIALGVTFGASIGMPLTAYLCEFGPFGGWPSAFIVSGVVTIIWLGFWFYFVTDFPSQNKRVTITELNFIQGNKEGDNRHNKNAAAPWKAIFSSMGVWSSIIAKATAIFSIQVVHSKLPVYLETILKFPLQKNGLANAAINFSGVFSTIFAGLLADHMHRRKVCSLTVIRKGFQTMATLGPIIAFTLIPSASSNPTVVMGLLIFAMTTIGMMSGGDFPITTDMAPHFSGTLFGVTNTVASAMGFVAPGVVGIILDQDNGSAHQWNIVFYLCAALLLSGMLFFNIFATAEVQPWGLVPDNSDNEKLAIDEGAKIKNVDVD